MAVRQVQAGTLNTGPTCGPDDVDHHLVARILAHEDADAFGELVRRHQSRVRLFLRRLCRDPSRADDLAQDCFLHAFEKLSGFRGRGSFVGWLLRIAWTTFLQSKRKNDRYHAVLDTVLDTDLHWQEKSAADADLADLDRLLSVLAEDERAVLTLSYACGLSHREISAAIDMPVGSVKSVIHRAKRKIRSRFDIEDHQYG